MPTCGLICTVKLMSGGEVKGTAWGTTGGAVFLSRQPVVLSDPMEFMGKDRVSDAPRDVSWWLNLLFVTEFPFPGTDLV